MQKDTTKLHKIVDEYKEICTRSEQGDCSDLLEDRDVRRIQTACLAGIWDLVGEDSVYYRQAKDIEKGIGNTHSFLAEQIGVAEALLSEMQNVKKDDSPKKITTFETLFDTYTKVQQIGEGGSGTVYKVKNSSDDTLALKYLPPDKVTAEKIKRFKNEIYFCSKETHKNVVKVLDYGFIRVADEKCLFYVMPLYPGSLRKVMHEGVSRDKILPMFSQIIDGIEAAHLKGVCHRDLKPENILADSQELVVADFGIADFEEDALYTSVQTKAGTRVANFIYAAPEQKVRGAKVDSKADIYSLGLILNEMFTGLVPQGDGYKKISEVVAEFGYLDELVSWMIQQDPNSRPPTVDIIKRELIARHNLFVAQQKLESKNAEVVPASKPGTVAPVSITSVDYQNRDLLLKLSRIPEEGWVERFHRPVEGFESIMGKGPETFIFRGDMCAIVAEHDEAQQLVNYFKKYSEMATRAYQRELNNRAAQAEIELREKLEREKAETLKRRDLLRNIKI